MTQQPKQYHRDCHIRPTEPRWNRLVLYLNSVYGEDWQEKNLKVISLTYNEALDKMLRSKGF